MQDSKLMSLTCASFIGLCHNHHSQNSRLSQQEIELTKRMVLASRVYRAPLR